MPEVTVNGGDFENCKDLWTKVLPVIKIIYDVGDDANETGLAIVDIGLDKTIANLALILLIGVELPINWIHIY